MEVSDNWWIRESKTLTLISNKMKNIAILIVLMAFWVNYNSFSQEYLYEIRVKVSADACGACNHWPIKDVYYAMVNDTRLENIITDWNWYPYDVWQYIYAKVTINDQRIIRWNDPAEDSWETRTFLPDPTKIQSFSYHGTDGGISWHSTWLTAEVETYDPVSATSVQCGSESGFIQCVKNINDNITFNLSAQHISPSAFISISAYDEHDALIQSDFAGFFSATKTYKFSDFKLQNYWEKQVKFVITTGLGGNSISSTTNWYVFTTPFPRPTITPISPICFGQMNASVRLDFTTDDVSRYNFSISQLKRKININDQCDINLATDEPFSEYYKDRNYCLTGASADIIRPASNTTLTIDNNSLRETAVNNGLKDAFGAGSYQLIVESASGFSCLFDTLITIPDAPDLILASASPQNKYTSDIDGQIYQIKSFGSTDAILINTSGGHLPYQYSINNGVTYSPSSYSIPYTYTGVAAGNNYNVRVKDANGCLPSGVKVLPVTMKQPDTISITASAITNVSCDINNAGNHKDGKILMNIKGGIGYYTATLNLVNGKTFSGLPYSFTLDALEAKTYHIHIQDKYVTHKDTTVVIPSFSHLGFNPVLPTDKAWPHCVDGEDGSLKVSGYGGVSFNSGGKYQFSLFDNGNNPVDGTLQADTAQFENLLATTYKAVITDKLHCQDSVMGISIPQNPNPLTLVLKDTIPALCHAFSDGIASFTAINGLPYYNGFDFTLHGVSHSYVKSLRNDTAVFDDLKNGIYEISVQDQYNCVINNYYRDTIAISEPDQILIKDSVRQVSRKGANNGYLQVSLTGGNKKYKYEWYRGLTALADSLIKSGKTNNTAFVGNLGTGDYLLRIQDTCGCNNGMSSGAWLEWTRHIGEPAKSLSFTVTEHKNVSCNGLKDGRLVIDGVGGWGNNYRFGLHPDKLSYDGEFNQLPAGLDTIYVADEQNEIFFDTIRITEPEALTATLASVTQPKCFGNNDGGFNLSVTGGTLPYYVSVDNNLSRTKGSAISGLPAGTYDILVSDSNACKTTLRTLLPQPDSLHIELTNIIQTRCGEASGSLFVNTVGGTPDFVYQWTDDKNSVKGSEALLGNLPAGVYRVSVTDNNQCKKTSPWYTVSNSNGPAFSNTVITPVSCFGYADGKVKVTVEMGKSPYTYEWSNGQHSSELSGVVSGDYFVTVTDQENCPNMISVFVPTPQPLALRTITANDPQCFGYSNGSVTVEGKGGTSPYQYLWDNGQTGATAAGLSEGVFKATIADIRGCKTDSVVTLTNPQPVVVDLGGKVTICGGQNVPLDAGPFTSFSWSSDNGFTSKERNVNLSQQGNYFLEVIDSKGCIGRDTFKITTSNSLLNADFIIKSEAFTGDTVVAINISWPLPQNVYWVYDTTTINHFSQTDYENLIFTQPGIYTITMYATLGECKDNYSHEITIKPDENQKMTASAKEEPLIQKFIVHPNPNNGNFIVEVELREQSDIILKFYEGPRVIDQKRIKGLDNYNVGYSLPNLTPGIYILQLLAGDEQKQLKLIIY